VRGVIAFNIRSQDAFLLSASTRSELVALICRLGFHVIIISPSTNSLGLKKEFA